MRSTMPPLLLLTALVASTVAVPVSERGQCARYCTESSEFTMTPGMLYTYDYETTAVTTLAHDKTQLQMTAQADVQILSKCELALRLRGVVLKLSDPGSPEQLAWVRGGRDFAQQLEASVLHFSWQDGSVQHVCPRDGTPDWVLNVQKGVLSALQTHAVKPDWTTRVEETDILGKCTAEYISLGKSWQGVHTIRKLKDLSSCKDREHVSTFLHGAHQAPEFAPESLPVLRGNQECEQVQGDGFLQSSSCSEKLVFRPFQGAGVTTHVTQKLTHTATTRRTFTGNDYHPTTQSLLYTHDKNAPTQGRADVVAENALKELCDVSKVDVTLSVPRKFSGLVSSLKSLNSQQLKAFYQKTDKICPDNSKARKFFLDAVPLVGSAECARFMLEMIESRTVSKSESSFWLTSLAFVSKPTAETIATFTPLLDGRLEQAILGVSSLVKNFCSDKDCSESVEVRAAVQRLFANLGEKCFSPDDKKIILSLKAIGNIGFLFDNRRTLEACYKNPQIRMEARVAALQAFRRVPCGGELQELTSTYRNYDEDTEIRIAAYLALMRCPSAEVIDTVKQVMDGEKINHVGSFVWTHLDALSRSRHPERQLVREVLSDLRLLNRFGGDARRMSGAREHSFFLPSLDAGLHLDSQVVFSAESFLPRTAALNLTVDVFGKACNLLEVGGRMEGMEHMVESFFGPGGYFPQKEVTKLLRERRSLSENKLERITKEFNEHRPSSAPYGSLDVKVLGTSLWYGQMKEAPQLDFLQLVSQLAQEREQHFQRSFVFLDTQLTVPTASGLPLKVALNGTASVALKVGGKFDVKSFESVDVMGHFEPSGAVEISSVLHVEAGSAVRSGLRVVSTLHSSTLLDGRLEVRDGEVVKAQVNMPRDRIDVLNVQSNVILVHGAEERERQAPRRSATQHRSCTGNRMEQVLGLRLCGEMKLPQHPLHGAATVALYLEKTDPGHTSYTFDAQWKTTKKNGGLVRSGVLALNTPGSTTDRDVKLELQLSQPERAASIKIKSPLTRIDASAKAMYEERHKKLQVLVNVDESELFSMLADMRSEGDEHTPTLQVHAGGKRLAQLSGSVQLRSGSKYAAQLKLEDLTEMPVIAKVNVELGRRLEAEASLNSWALEGSAKLSGQRGDSAAARLQADYRLMQGKTYSLLMAGKLRDLSANALTKYSGLLSMQASAIPDWNTEVSFTTMATAGLLESQAALNLGDGVRSRVHTIQLSEIVKYKIASLSDNKVDATLTYKYLERNADYTLTVNHENTDTSLKNKLRLQYAAGRKLETEIALRAPQQELLSLQGEAKLSYPGRNMKMQVVLDQPTTREYRGSIAGQWRDGAQVASSLHLKDLCEGSAIKYEAKGSLLTPFTSPVEFTTTIGSNNGQYAGISEMKVGSEKYRAKADVVVGRGLNHRLSGQLARGSETYALDAAVSHARDKLSCNAEMKTPSGRRVTAKLEGRATSTVATGSFEANWDADRSNSKRFLVGGELRSQVDGYDAKLALQFKRLIRKAALTTSLQGKIFSSQWTTNNRFELLWSPTETFTAALSSNALFDRQRHQMSTHIEVTSPYSGFENQTFSLNHLSTHQQWESEVSTMLPKGNSIALSSSGKYAFSRGATLDTKAKLRTSFRGLEAVDVAFSHDHNSRELQNKAEVTWGSRKRLQYLVSGRRQGSTVTGSIQVTSPFAKYEDLSGAFSHDFTSGNHKTKGELKWARGQMMTFSAAGNHELSGRRRICSVTFEADSPFRGYESSTLKMVYSNDGSAVNTEAEAVLNRLKVASSLSLSMSKQYSVRNVEGKFQLTTPFRNLDSVQVSSSLEITKNSYKFNADVQLPKASTLSLNSQGRMDGIHDAELNVVYIANVPLIASRPRRISIDFAHKLQNSKLRSSFDAAYNKDRVTLLVVGLAESSYNFRNIELSTTLTTPFTTIETLKGEFTHNQKGNEYYTKVFASKNLRAPHWESTLIHKMNIENILNFGSSLEVTTSDNLYAKLSVDQSGNSRDLNHNSIFQWDKNNKVHLSAQYVQKALVKEALVKLTTPFSTLREVELKADTECDEWNHKGVISVSWNQRNKVAISGDFKNLRWESINSHLQFSSPFTGHEFYATSLKYDVTAPQKEAELAFQWDAARKKSVVVKGSVLHSSHLKSLEAAVTTPFRDFEKIVASARYDDRAPEKFIKLEYERGWRRLRFDGKTLTRKDSAEVNVDFRSPYENYKQISASAKYNKVSKGIKGDMSINMEKNNKYTLAGEYEQSRDKKAKVTISATSPIPNFERVNAEASVQNEGSKTISKLTYEWGNGKQIFFEGDFDLMPEKKSLALNLKTPFANYRSMNLNSRYELKRYAFVGSILMSTSIKNYESVNFDVNAKKRGSQLEYKATAGWGANKKIAFESITDLTAEKGSVSVGLKTPFEGYKTFSLDSRYELMQGERYAMGILTLSTPFKNLENLNAEMNVQRENSQLRSKFILGWATDKQITLNSQIVLSAETGHLTIQLDTPIKNYESFKLTSKYEHPRRQSSTTGMITFTMPSNNIVLESSMVYAGPELKHQFTAKWGEGKTVTFDASLAYGRERAVLTINARTPFSGHETYSMNANYDIHIREFNGLGSITLNTPFRDYENIKLEGSLENGAKTKWTLDWGRENQIAFDGELDFDAENGKFVLKLKTPFESYRNLQLDSSYERKGRNLGGEVSVTTPFKNYESIQLTANIDRLGNVISPKLVLNRGRHQPLELSGRFDLTREKSSSMVNVKISAGTITLTSRHDLQTRLTTGFVSLKTPFRGYEGGSIDASMRTGRNNHNPKLTLNWGQNTASFEGTYDVTKEKGALVHKASTRIASNLLPSRTLDVQGRFYNNDGRDVMVTLSLTSPDATHAVTASVKNYAEDKFVQLKIECPMSHHLNPFSVTGTFKRQNRNTLDASLSIACPVKEFRIAGTVKNAERDTEAVLTLNTPFDPLTMVRLDGRLSRNGGHDAALDVKLESSHPALQELQLTSKLSGTPGSRELSLMLKLPLRDLRSVQLLGNMHYASDYSSADSRVTLTLPRGKYVAYGQYGANANRLSGRAEVEVDRTKYAVTGRMDLHQTKKDLFVTFTTPSSETYTIGGAYGISGNRRDAVATYNGPRNARYNMNTSLTFDDAKNFAGDFQLETPFRGYERIQGSLQQKSSSRHASTNIEYSLREGQKAYAKYHHNIQRDGTKRSLQIACPYHHLRDVRVTYNDAKKGPDTENMIQLEYDRSKVAKVELLQGEKSANLALEVPSASLTLKAGTKKSEGGREFQLESSLPSRVVDLRTSYSWTGDSFSHDANLAWDAKRDKRARYEVRVGSGELLTSVVTPWRSALLRGNWTLSGRSTSAGAALHFDAARTPDKAIALGFAHSDASNSREIAHRLQLTLLHPSLEKPVVSTSVLRLTAAELHAKSELQYSPNRDDNLLLELKATDMTQKDTHLKAEVNARHLSSRVDVRATGELISGRLETQAQLKLYSADMKMAQNVRELRARLAKLRKEIEVVTRFNEDQTSYTAQMSGRGGDVDVTAERQTNDRKDGSATLHFSRRSRKLEASVTNGEGDGMAGSASWPAESVGAQAWRVQRGSPQPPLAQLFLGLQQQRTLASRLTWRTGRHSSICMKWAQAIVEDFKTWRQSFSEELPLRADLVSQSLSKAFSPLAEDLKREGEALSSDWRDFKTSLGVMYDRNGFFVKDIAMAVEEMKEVTREVMNGLALGYEVLYNVTMEQLEEIYYAAQYKLEDLVEYMSKVWSLQSRKLDEIIRVARLKAFEALQMAEIKASICLRKVKEAVANRVERLLKPYEGYIVQGYYYMQYAADQVRNSINGATDLLTKNSWVLALNEYLEGVAEAWSSLQGVDILRSVYDRQLFERVTQHPSVQYLSAAANAALVRSVEIYHQLGMDSVASAAIERSTRYLKTLALNSAQEMVSDFYRARSGFKWERAPGKIMMEVQLPAPRNSLLEALDVRGYAEYERAKNLHTLAAEYYEDFCVWDLYYRVLKYFRPSYWLPAFNGVATISGHQHYVTFDGRAFEFAGRCTYLLAHDFRDGNFTAAVSYDQRGQRKTLTVLVAGGRRLDIGTQDGKMALDGARVEAPLQIGDVTVLRGSSDVVVEDGKRGYSVRCNVVQNWCSVSLSGFYFGRTAGLFGTFDLEPSLDFMTPRRLLARDVDSFARSWEIGHHECRQSDNIARRSSSDSSIRALCGDIFERNASPFRACFKQVDPTPYMRMCTADVSAVIAREREDAVCESAAAYFSACAREGVTLRLPAHCVRCEKQNGGWLREGESLQLPRDGPVTAADVVFLVEEKPCNADKARYLTKLASGIEESLRGQGYSADARYAVVGFGGRGVHSSPHLHTMDGKDAGSLRALESTVGSLVFDEDSGPNNVLEALRFAAQLRFRVGATKRFVLLKCSACNPEEDKAEYSELVRILLDSEISLHLLMEQKYEMKVPSKNSKARRVIGVDNQLAYTLRDVKEGGPRGDGDLLVQLRLPRDVCVPLALESRGGSSFDSAFLPDVRRNTSKKFVDVLARLVGARHEGSGSMCCECIADEEGVGRSVCQRCVVSDQLRNV